MTHSNRHPQVSVFLALSLDGFIASEDGGIDWLMKFEDPKNEDYGFKEFFESVDVLVMGRNTYNVARSFDTWPYGDKRIVVLTRRPLEPRHNEKSHSGPLAPLVKSLGDEGVCRIYLDGGNAIRQGLAAKLVDDMTLTLIPTVLGKGIPLFGADVPESDWKLVESRSFSNGLVQVQYRRSG